MGKGSVPRPIPDRKGYEDNWDQIFGKKKEKDEPIHDNKQPKQ